MRGFDAAKWVRFVHRFETLGWKSPLFMGGLKNPKWVRLVIFMKRGSGGLPRIGWNRYEWAGKGFLRELGESGECTRMQKSLTGEVS
jgi:hypothetical protein